MVAPFALAPGEAATLIVAYYSQGASRLSMSVETPESFVPADARQRGEELRLLRHDAGDDRAGDRGAGRAAPAGLRRLCRLPDVVFMYVAHADGAAFQYVWPNFPRFNSMASVVAGSGVMVFGGLFAITFLQTARYHPIMHRVLQAVVASVSRSTSSSGRPIRSC
jgi:hypothetical protein